MDNMVKKLAISLGSVSKGLWGDSNKRNVISPTNTPKKIKSLKMAGILSVGPNKKSNNKYEEARYSNPLLKPISKKVKPKKTVPSFKTKAPMKDKNMNWAQVKWKYPKLKPMGDKDRDGVKNMLDCKPLDRKRQGVSHKFRESGGSRRKISMTDNELEYIEDIPSYEVEEALEDYRNR